LKNVYQPLFPAVFLAVGIGYEVMALSMPLGGFGSPGPGLYPLIVGAALALTSAACLVQSLISVQPATATLDDVELPVQGKTDARKAALLAAALVVYAVLLKPLGFDVALTLLLVASIRIFGYSKWLRNLAMSVLMTVLAHIVFILWLKVPLPLGILTELLY
jgi:hypothetical protein